MNYLIVLVYFATHEKTHTTPTTKLGVVVIDWVHYMDDVRKVIGSCNLITQRGLDRSIDLEVVILCYQNYRDLPMVWCAFCMRIMTIYNNITEHLDCCVPRG